MFFTFFYRENHFTNQSVRSVLEYLMGLHLPYIRQLRAHFNWLKYLWKKKTRAFTQQQKKLLERQKVLFMLKDFIQKKNMFFERILMKVPRKKLKNIIFTMNTQKRKTEHEWFNFYFNKKTSPKEFLMCQNILQTTYFIGLIFF